MTHTAHHKDNLHFHPQLPLGPNGERGADVRHNFQARKTYCILTVQWSCGEVVGWGKCYESESETQVFGFMNEVWPEKAEDQRPDFIAYDSTCKMLRHLLVHHFNTSWIRRTRFIVDAFHYVSPIASAGSDVIQLLKMNHSLT